MAIIPVEEKKKEAVARMRQAGIFGETIRQFDEEGLVSESIPPFGACYWIDDKQKEAVKQFEEKYNGLVYHVMRYRLEEMGETWTFLYVSDYKNEWEMDRADIDEGRALAYVYYVSEPMLSEFIEIGIHLTAAAGVERIW